jgi:rare lipoprotein A
MQTKLRIIPFLIVVSLLWTSPMSAATTKTKLDKKPQARPRYVGVASWYGANRQGRKMANGQKFDRQALTAASWYFPLGTVIHVINLSNGNAVTVTVTDRGPNLRLNRVVDLSEVAAQQLDYVDHGLTRVFVIPTASVRLEHAEFNAELAEPPQDKQPLVASDMLTETLN